MKITNSKFVISVVNENQFPKSNFIEVAFAGRSNAGKSSLINALANNGSLARSSATPGKTRQLNFYNINDELFYVDLPGYGYASVSEKENELFNSITDFYLNQRQQLYLILLLLDIRHDPTKQDLQMIEWLKASELNFIIVANKADKLSKNEIVKSVQNIRKITKLTEKTSIVPVSCTNKYGIEDLHKTIDKYIMDDK